MGNRQQKFQPQVDDNAEAAAASPTVAETEKKKEEKKGTDWKVLITLMPYLWPKNQIGLRIRVLVAMLFLIGAKVVTVFMPLEYKVAIDSMTVSDTNAQVMYPVAAILIYALLRLLSRAFADLRDWVFLRVSQYSIRTTALDVFSHMHQLTIQFHLNRKTGSILRNIDRGTKGIQFILQFVLFNIVPTFVEIIMVTIILLVQYEPWFAIMTLGTVAGYVVFTIAITEWRVKIRQDMNEKDNLANDRAVDSLLNFETVKSFNAAKHETERYDEALIQFQEASLRTQYSLALLNIGQNAIITVGSLGAMLLSAWRVYNGAQTIGDFVLVNSYIIQLYSPLGFLGTAYRMIKTSLVDMRGMFDLAKEKVEIEDRPEAGELQLRQGEVEFRNVFFSYEAARPILKGISFKVPAGSSCAIVGATGAGKSTISRLLFRFYEKDQGEILIDGQEISEVTQGSLRDVLGIVPQDCTLFNDTIEYNIRFAKPHCSHEDVEQAAKAAQIHDFIMSLPDQYETKVGERGLRLSGGEKQRVAIARAILKNPPIIMMDEATSALDVKTERDIQASLSELSKERTSLTIAHRLSTVIHSDQIIVLKDGVVLERGTHQELLNLKGEYYQLWSKQAESSSSSASSSKSEQSSDSYEIVPAVSEPASQLSITIEK